MTPDAEALLYDTTTKGGRYIKRGGLVIPYAGQQANPNRKLVPGENFRPELYLPKLVRDAVDQHHFYRDHATVHGRDDRRGPFFITSMPLAWGVYGFKNDAALSAIELCKTAAGWHQVPFEAGFEAMAVEMVRRGVKRGYVRPGHEGSGPWYGCYYGIDPRLVEPGPIRDEFLRRADDILKGDHPDTFSPERFKQLVEGLAEDGDRATPWKLAFRGMADMIHDANDRHGLTEPGVLVNWNMAHGAAEPSGAGTPDADREFSRAIRQDGFPGADAVDVMDLDFYGRGDGRSPEEAIRTLAEWGGLCRTVGVMRVAYSETWVQFHPPTGAPANTASSDRQALEWFQTVWPHYAAQALGHGGFDLEYVQVWASGRPEREAKQRGTLPKFTYRPEVEDIPLTADYLIDNWYGPDPQGRAALIEPDLSTWGDAPPPEPQPEPEPEPPIVVDPPTPDPEPDPEPEPDPGPDVPASDPNGGLPAVELVTHYPAWDRNPEMRAVGHPNTGEPTIVTIMALAANTDRVGFRMNGGEWVQLTGDPVGQSILVPSGSSIDVRGRRPGATHQWVNDWTTVHGV